METPPKTAVIGADGFVGSHFHQLYKQFDPHALGTGTPGSAFTPQLDLHSPDISPFHLADSGYKDVIIAAAVTGIAQCENEKEYARACNVEGTLELIRQISQEELKPIFFSSDYVFDGVEGGYTEDAPLRPLDEYGAQKAEVERRFSEVCNGDCLIIRPCKLFGLKKGDGTLLDEMANNLSQGLPVRAAYDQWFCPIWIHDFSRAVLALQTRRITGTVHLCTAKPVSRLDLALAMADALGVDRRLVQSISLDDLNENFKRPKRTNLVCKRLPKDIQAAFKPLSECVHIAAENYRKDN